MSAQDNEDLQIEELWTYDPETRYDVSPGGPWITASSESDLMAIFYYYVADIEIRDLTTGQFLSAIPNPEFRISMYDQEWSPDGRRLAFLTASRNVYVFDYDRDTGGTLLLQLSDIERFDWGSSENIVTQRYTTYDLFNQPSDLSVVNVVTGETQLLFEETGTFSIPLEWSTDERYLAYGIHTRPTEDSSLSEIIVYDMRTNTRYSLAGVSTAYPQQIAWLPDNTLVGLTLDHILWEWQVADDGIVIINDAIFAERYPPSHPNNPDAIAFQPDQGLVAIRPYNSLNSAPIEIFDVRTGAYLSDVNGLDSYSFTWAGDYFMASSAGIIHAFQITSQ